MSNELSVPRSYHRLHLEPVNTAFRKGSILCCIRCGETKEAHELAAAQRHTFCYNPYFCTLSEFRKVAANKDIVDVKQELRFLHGMEKRPELVATPTLKATHKRIVSSAF